MGIAVTDNHNYSVLHADTKTTVATAIAAIRAAYAEAISNSDDKDNVRVIFREIVELQEES